MTVSEGMPLRPEIGGCAHERAIIHRELHGCHLRERDLRKLAETVNPGLSKRVYSTRLRAPGESSKAKEVSRDSLEELLEVVHREAGGHAKVLENLRIRAGSRGQRFVQLDITADRVAFEVRGAPDDPEPDWADGRDVRLREMLEPTRRRLRIPGRARIQVPVGMMAGGALGLAASLAVAGAHPRALGATLLVAAGMLIGTLGGVISAHCRRTVVMLKDRASIGGWVTLPTLAESLVIFFSAAATAIAVVAILLTPAPQYAAPPVVQHAIGRK